MKLIVGLGNPGKKYAGNRHNVGHMVFDKLTRTPELQMPRQVKVVKSKNFMNDSGGFVKDLVNRYSLSTNDLFIIHDDLDLPLGAWKMQIGKGPKEHGGINDIEEKLRTKDFTRIRVGVDNRKPESKVPGEEYVLEDFTKEEKKILNGVIKEVCKKLATILKSTN